jgi:3-methyl-2-oxobutanoate hydroxymethyltransferase
MTIPDIVKAKGRRKLSMLTAYDYPTALAVDACGVDMILVGDSLAMVVLGHEDTLGVGMEEMLHHTRAVSRAAGHALVVGDMPFLSYQTSVQEAVYNAGLFLKQAKAQAVKLEGGASVLDTVRAIVQAGIPVQGHLGLTPQSAAQLGGFKVQGRSVQAARQLIDDARALEGAGCFSIVLEAIPAEIAARVTEAVSIPTIGIGAGAECDGQVLVLHDLVGLFDRFTPKFVKQYADMTSTMKDAVSRFKAEVEKGAFPEAGHSFFLSEDERRRLQDL